MTWYPNWLFQPIFYFIVTISPKNAIVKADILIFRGNNSYWETTIRNSREMSDSRLTPIKDASKMNLFMTHCPAYLSLAVPMKKRWGWMERKLKWGRLVWF
jgi:hypothetical protein